MALRRLSPPKYRSYKTCREAKALQQVSQARRNNRIRSSAEAVSVSRYCSMSLANGPLRSASVGRAIRLLEPSRCRISAILGYMRMNMLRATRRGIWEGHMTPHWSNAASASDARRQAFMTSKFSMTSAIICWT